MTPNPSLLLLVVIIAMHWAFAPSARGQDLIAVEDSIALHFSNLKASRDDDQRTEESSQMRAFFIEALNYSETFDYPFSRVEISRLTSTDGRMRIINWNQPMEDGSFKYYAFVLMRENITSPFTWLELVQQPREVDKPETKFMTPDKWMGALYYEIIPMQEKKKKPADTYVLIGWDGKDNLSTRKVIDAITITGKNKIRLGAAIFDTPKGLRKRVIYEYSEDVSSSVRYYPKKKCIVVDHLSPKNPLMEGVYSEYGPDGTYDLFQLEKGKWTLIENIDVSEFSKTDDRPYLDPRVRR